MTELNYTEVLRGASEFLVLFRGEVPQFETALGDSGGEHATIGSKDQLQPLANSLTDTFHVHTFNFSGHGGRPFPHHSFSIPLFSDQIAEYMQEQGILQAHIFGYSMGGFAALYLAKQHPDKINKLITLATKLHWDEKTAAKEVQLLDANTIRQKVPAFAAQLHETGSAGSKRCTRPDGDSANRPLAFRFTE